MTDTRAWTVMAARYSAGQTVMPQTGVPAPYVFNATVLAWHDGDTGWFELDRGVYEYARWDIRLLGCNAAELGTPGGDAAAANIKALLPAGTAMVLSTAKADKFGGRLDAQVTFLLNGVPTDLVSYLCAQQWAAPWNGQGTKPVPPWPRTVTSEKPAGPQCDLCGGDHYGFQCPGPVKS